MRPALKHVLETATTHSVERQKNLILITDAQIGNESAILDLMKGVSDFPVHCFGIDVALNDSLLLALCRQQGGSFHSLNPNDDIERAVTTLGKTLGQPVLLDLRLSDGWEMADATIPNLYAGQIHYLSARSRGGASLELVAQNGSSEPLRLQFERHSAAGEAPYLHWCKSRIQRRLAENKTKEAIDLSVRSNLLCRLTAFIAWDESEKVTVASHSLVQPSMEVGRFKACAAAAPVAGGALAKKRSGGGFFDRLFGSEVSESLTQIRELISEKEPDQELADIGRRFGTPDWQPFLKALADWLAEATGAERGQRIARLRILVDRIKVVIERIESLQHRLEEQRKAKRPLDSHYEKQIEEMKRQIGALLKSFAEKLPASR
jgi:hypothetical protein